MIVVSTVSTSEREERAFKRFLEVTGSALREYDAALSDEERAFESLCQCQLCEGMRAVRSMVTDHRVNLGRWRATLLRVLDARVAQREADSMHEASEAWQL